MDYYAACDALVTQAEAAAEIRNHDLEPADFFAEVGIKEEYEGAEVLGWLGY